MGAIAENGRGSFSKDKVGIVPPVYVVDPVVQGPLAPPAKSPLRSMPIDFVVKDDDDFTAGPGEFIPVPKASMRFWVEHHGPALFFIQAVFGWTGFPARSDHLGILVDREIHPVVSCEAMQSAPGVGIFRFGGPSMHPVNLAPGEHFAQVLLRGGHDDGEVKMGLSLPCKVLANPKCPLSLAVMHS